MASGIGQHGRWKWAIEVALTGCASEDGSQDGGGHLGGESGRVCATASVRRG